MFRGQGFGGGGAGAPLSPPFTMDDVTAIENDISAYARGASSNTQAQAIYGNSNGRRMSPAPATVPGGARLAACFGRNFSESELRAGAAVCLLGDTVKQELFGDQDPIGLSIRLGKLSAR